MTSYTATYDPADDKIRLYASSRLDSETYERAKKVGFRWAPAQELFFTVWSPHSEDLALELAGEIEDEDTSLMGRADRRADRFETYSENRTRDAKAAAAAVSAIADNIPFGQPILVGHHSERRARKDAERIENGMRKAVKMWDTASYWQGRAAAAVRAAKYKELPSVRFRRIKKLEADLRKVQRNSKDAEQSARLWRAITEKPEAFKKDGEPVSLLEAAKFVAGRGYFSACFPLADYPRDPPASQYEGQMGLWSALEDGVCTPEQAQAIAIPAYERSKAYADRWIAHYENRLAYERAMAGEGPALPAQETKLEKGGAVRCWASPGNGAGWSFIHKVNRVSVTVLDNWGNGGRNFTRNMPIDKLKGVMTAAQVEQARAEGRLIEDAQKTGFFLKSAEEAAAAAAEPPKVEPASDSGPAPDFEAMRATLKDGIKTVVAPQLFVTPPELAERVVREADIQEGQRVLEPSAGTGSLLDTTRRFADVVHTVAVEINPGLADGLRQRYPSTKVHCADFLECNGDLGRFDRIVMNPPFADRADVRHVMKAAEFLNPGGRLVAIVSAGATFREDRLTREFREWVNANGGTIEPLPVGSFKTSGTDVNAAIVVVDNG